MRVVGTEKLLSFAATHPNTRSWIQGWLAEARDANWRTPHDVKARFPSVSFLAKNFLIFNVKGNEHRMVAQISYQSKVMVVKWIGTHQEYDRVNWEKRNDEAHGN
jgi:mRNA interferase HigB